MTRQYCYWIAACLLFSCGKDNGDRQVEKEVAYLQLPAASFTSKCSDDLESRCKDVREKLSVTQAQLNIAIASIDRPAIAQLQMELGELYELLQAYLRGQSDTTEIQDRYVALRNIMNAPANGSSSPKISYRTEELEAVRAVFRDFGDLYISPTGIDERGRPETLTLAVDDTMRPWAGYWYPKSKAEIFANENSPLRKFEIYLAKRGWASSIVSWEKERWQPGIYADWEGLCDALAMASVLTREPQSTLSLNEVDFTLADQKALALKYYEGFEPKVYGIRYEGSAESDGEMQDLRPEAFHRLVETFLQDKKQALVMDSDPGPEVWAKPVYKVTWKIYQDPDFANAYRVDAFLSMLTPRTDPPKAEDDPLTDYFTDTASPKYEYRLYVDPNDRRDNKLKVVAGEWLNDSLDQHPDMIFVPQSAFHTKQRNKELQKFEGELRKLLIEAKMFPQETVE